ncbi:hypothetical protein ASE17_09305 [Phenylobacterium sp. Root77]|uniref:hypothetical protein n=1 Tax=unclassified Phenylobacterium TaxID=2640670 RepID=UPI0006F399C2|nr:MULTISPECIES: hypothetical protein [unclassified Phenylobacterium]KQW73136.1 hypothetical protein ASC73_01875 [Phenylobacterium sp. Root1277]KQW92355.1 hypothetical protein ASC79_12585 [Phenylobacterium sp. Root1290]KRC40586.1 hypothetical protein ASE17_09305 [Phenylobacterium sp. Root77]
MALSIAAAIASLKTAGEIANGFLTLRDQAVIQSKVIELQSIILAAQQGAITAQSEQMELVDEIRALRAELDRLAAWSATADRYQLTDLGKGVFAYKPQAETLGSDPDHFACVQCFETGRRSVLQNLGRFNSRERLECQACKSAINVPVA